MPQSFAPHHDGIAAHLYGIGVRVLPHGLPHTSFSQLPLVPTMYQDPRRQERQENTLSVLNVTIEGLNLAKEASSGTPAKAVFGSVSIILSMIRVRFPHL